jgi:ATP-binding cassette subfamily C protein RsaD
MSLLTKSDARPTPLDGAMAGARPAIGIAILFSFFINILALVSPLYMLQVYDRVLSSRSEMTLLFITLIAVFLFVVYAALEALRTQVLVRAGIRFDGDVRGAIFRSVLDATLTKRPGGSQAFRDIDEVRGFMTGAGLITFCDAPWVPVFVVISFILHPFFGVLAVISGVAILGLAFANDYATRGPLQRATIAAISSQNDASATMRNSEVLRAMGMWGGLQERWQRRRDDLIAWQAQASDRGGGLMSIIKFLRQVVQTLILGGGAYLAINGKITPGAMIAASILVGRALAPIEQAVGQWKSFIGARGSWDRLQEMFRGEASAGARMSLPPPRGRLLVEAATIAPPGSQRPTIANVSFLLEPKTTLGVIGPSAAGKSSLVRALVGVWPTLGGAVRLDGFDLKQWDPEALGKYVGYLPQDVELFSGTVAENIARFAPYESADVIEAAQLAGVHTMIQGMANGYDTQIGDGGAALSGGQRQRLGLARTIYRRPPLLVLDEPNANLDAEGEQALANAIAQLKASSTIVFVTHKTNLLSLADKILVLRAGAVAGFGDRDDVLNQILGAPAPLSPPPSAPPSKAPQSHQAAPASAKESS